MTAYRAARCGHGMLPRMCAARNCPHWDGLRTAKKVTHTRHPRGRKRPTLKCRRCGRRVPRELVDARGMCPSCEPALALTVEDKIRMGGVRGD